MNGNAILFDVQHNKNVRLQAHPDKITKKPVLNMSQYQEMSGWYWWLGLILDWLRVHPIL